MDEEIIIGLFHWFCIGTWIIQMIRLYKRKDKTPYLITLILGLVTLFTIFLVGSGLFFWILVIVSLFLGRGKEETQKKKKKNKKNFDVAFVMPNIEKNFWATKLLKREKSVVIV